MLHHDILRRLGFYRQPEPRTQREEAIALLSCLPAPPGTKVDALEQTAPFPGEGIVPDSSITFEEWSAIRRVIASARNYADTLEQAHEVIQRRGSK